MRTAIFCLALAAASICSAQNFTSSQLPPKEQTFFGKQDTFRATGTAALSAELASEKTQGCPSGLDRRTIDSCMDHEFKITQKNYETYVHALSGLLRLGNPVLSNQSGIAKDFDKTELRWIAYRDTQCRIASNLGDGAIQGYLYLSCEQNLTRNHLDEIARLYKDLW